MIKSNFRPVRLLSVPSMIFEKVLVGQMDDYFVNIFDEF